ncbi:hypothetical protein Acr_00g0055210 [Actinidia rufa]|uniref:Uncharacterized protein n=1 Tax=Actinidia rufa TaxID=165716 RepID=A0A7J0DLU1_9ERIC|nr:hypothetical protein Acr_00g0055210 [Actinidia rufa]
MLFSLTFPALEHVTTRNARGRAKSLTGARGARGARGACRNHDEGDDGNHQESVMGVGQVLLEEMWEVLHLRFWVAPNLCKEFFTAIEQVVKNTIQTMQVPVRTAKSRATTAMKAFLQLRPPTFKGEPDSLVAEDWGMPSNDGRPWRKWVSSSSRSRGTISHPDTRTITSHWATYLLSVWSGWSYQSIVHAEGKQSGSYGITTTHSVSSGLEGHSSIYISTDFISVQTTGCSSTGSEDAGTGLRYNISNGTVGDSWTAGAVIRYLCCARYFTYV